MKTKKTIFTIAVALAFTGFVSAQTTNQVKVYTQEQINRGAGKDQSSKENATKFEEAPAGTVTVQTPATSPVAIATPTNTSVSIVQKKQTDAPVSKSVNYADKDKLAAERAKNSVHAPIERNSVKKTSQILPTVEPSKEIHYGPVKKQSTIQKPYTGSGNTIKHPEVRKPVTRAVPKSGTK